MNTLICSNKNQASSLSFKVSAIKFIVHTGGKELEFCFAEQKHFEQKKKHILSAAGSKIKLAVELCRNTENGWTLNTTLINGSAQNLDCSSLTIILPVIPWKPANCLLFHPQNIRFVRIQIPDDTSFVRDNLFVTPDRKFRLGDSEDYALPIMVILNRKTDYGFALGALTENIFNKEFNLLPDPYGMRIEIKQCLRGISKKSIAPGQCLAFESLFLCAGKNDFSAFLAHYRNEVHRNNKFIFQKSPLREELIWGSWNMKIHCNQSEDLILRNAEYIRKHFPKVKWIQIDEGWAINRMWGEAAYPDLDENVDTKKFPHGMKYVAGQIAAMGLKPAIWFPRQCRRNSLLYKEHPEWFMQSFANGEFLSDSPLVSLDPSVPAVREHLRNVFKTILCKWGYMGLKLDFFSESFYARDSRYRYPGKSGIELMWEMFEDVRTYLPADGYFLPGSMVSNANIFLGKYADIMRYAFDIDELEKKPELFFQLFQKSALLAMLGSDMNVLCDSDAVGYFHYLPESAEKTLALWCYISGMMIEIGGDLPNADQKRLLDLKPLFDNPINGSQCRILTKEFFVSNQTPVVLYNSEHRLLGIFNHSADQTITGSFNIEKSDNSLLRITKAHEFWSGELINTPNGNISYELPPLTSVGYRL